MKESTKKRVEEAVELLAQQASIDPRKRITIAEVSRVSGVSRASLHKPEFKAIIDSASSIVGEGISSSGPNAAEVTLVEENLLLKDEVRQLRQMVTNLQQQVFVLTELKSKSGAPAGN